MHWKLSEFLETSWRSNRERQLIGILVSWAHVARSPRGREQRLISRCRVEFDRPSGPVEAETEDLSSHGVFIRTDSLLPIGEETELRLTLPDGSVLHLPARVA